MTHYTTGAYYGGWGRTPDNQGNSGPPTATGLGAWGYRDMEFGGAGVISGVAKSKLNNGQIIVYPNAMVRLHHRISGLLVQQTLSGPDGSFIFTGLSDSEYYPVAFDPNNNYNAVVFDRVTPVEA